MNIQEVKDNTMWVVKHTWGRQVLTGRQLDQLSNAGGEDWWEDIKDVDFLAEQPNKAIQKLINEYLAGPVYKMSYDEFLNSKKGAVLMTKSYLEDNLLYEVKYEDGDTQTLSGKEIRYMEDQDEYQDFYWYANVEYMNVSKKQRTKELQEISDRYYKFLEKTPGDKNWYNFLDDLIEEGVIEK